MLTKRRCLKITEVRAKQMENRVKKKEKREERKKSDVAS